MFGNQVKNVNGIQFVTKTKIKKMSMVFRIVGACYIYKHYFKR
jgi:hypothetical protein